MSSQKPVSDDFPRDHVMGCISTRRDKSGPFAISASPFGHAATTKQGQLNDFHANELPKRRRRFEQCDQPEDAMRDRIACIQICLTSHEFNTVKNSITRCSRRGCSWKCSRREIAEPVLLTSVIFGPLSNCLSETGNMELLLSKSQIGSE
jgi:hypothetical protein